MKRKVWPTLAGLSVVAIATAQSPRLPQRLDFNRRVLDPVVASSGDLTVAAYIGDGRIFARSSDGTGKSWSNPVRVDTDPGRRRKDFSQGHEALQIVEDRVYVLWSDERLTAGKDDLLLCASPDGGRSWSPERRINSSSAPGTRSVTAWRLAASAGPLGDLVYVLYAEENGAGEDLYLTASLDGGVTFAPPVEVPTPFAFGSFDVDAIDLVADGFDVYVVWDDDRLGGGDAVWFQKSSNGGATWLPNDVTLNLAGSRRAGADSDGECVLAVGGTTVAAVWTEDPLGLGNDELWLNVSLDGGVSFVGPTRVGGATPSVDDVDEPWVVVTPAGVVAVAWADNRTGSADHRVYATASPDGGLTFEPDAPLSTTDGHAPRLVAAGARIVAAWSEGPAGAKTMAASVSADAGRTWAAGITVSASAGDVDDAGIAFNARYDNIIGIHLADDLGADHAYAGGFRLPTVTSRGWGSSAPTVRFDLSGFQASDTAAVVGLSTATGPLTLPDGRQLCLAPDGLFLATAGSPAFQAVLTAGTGSTPAFFNPFAGAPALGITVHFAAFASGGGGTITGLTDAGAITL